MCENDSALDDFLSFMSLPNGTPLVTPDMVDYLIDGGFFTAPASTKFHGACIGGLYAHSRSVTNWLLAMTKNEHLVWTKERSPYIIGMFHDLCKIDQYRHPKTGMYVWGEEVVDKNKWEHNPDTLLKGHGDKSVMLLSQFYKLTEEEIMCIRYHMGAFTPESEWRDYTRAVNNYPNVLWTHQADMLASHVEGV